MKGFRKGDHVRIKSTGELCYLTRSIYKNSKWAHVLHTKNNIIWTDAVSLDDIEKAERK